jgi:predicted DNA-binding transcriptional regulator AlpA
VSSDSHTAVERQQRQKIRGARRAVVLALLPSSVTDNRILNADEVAALAGYSVPHWREMYRDGRAPPPIRLSARRYGWKVSTILAWLDSKSDSAA